VSRKEVVIKMPLKGEHASRLETLYSIEQVGLSSLIKAAERAAIRPGGRSRQTGGRGDNR
jgi:hypothetical protein